MTWSWLFPIIATFLAQSRRAIPSESKLEPDPKKTLFNKKVKLLKLLCQSVIRNYNFGGRLLQFEGVSQVFGFPHRIVNSTFNTTNRKFLERFPLLDLKMKKDVYSFETIKCDTLN